MALNTNDIAAALDSKSVVDQSVPAASGGSFTPRRIPMGRHPIRMISYVELGVQEGGMYAGKQKPDENQARLTFEFLGKRTITEGEDGKISVPMKSVTKKLSYHPKAGFFKMFNQLRGGDNSITHAAQMIGTKAWLVSVVWRTKDESGQYFTIKKSEVDKYEERLKSAKTDAQRKDYRIFDNIEWSSLSAPVTPVLDEDGEDTGEVRPLSVRESVNDFQLFLWDNPTPELWGSIFIEGEYTREVNGETTTFSRNFLQNIILGAKNFAGSPIEDMLNGVDTLGEELSESPAVAEEAEAVTEVTEDVDEFDELGL